MFAALVISMLLTVLPAGQTDSLALLESKVVSYLEVLRCEPVSVKVEETDFLLGKCRSGEVRDRVARRAYAFYMDSPIMGDEAVAIHLTDKWFSPGLASFATDLDLMNARLFADFNRNSLIGMQAPALTLTDMYGEGTDVLAKGEGRLRILYFFDTDCATCRVVTPALANLLKTRTEPMELIAVYTGDDAREWALYRKDKLPSETPSLKVSHYWDPSGESDFAMQYGVLQTPAMFLLSPGGRIIGRKLDPEALKVLLDEENASLDYGSESSDGLFAKLLPPGGTTVEDIRLTAESILSRTEGSSRMRRQLTGDLLYYLASKKGQAFKEGAAYVADSLVLSDMSLWRSDDSLKVVGLANFVHDMYGRAPVGAVVPDVEAKGLLRGGCRDRSKTFRLAKLRCETFVLFVSQGCADCRVEIEAVSRRVELSRSKGLTAVQRKALRGVRYLIVDMDELWSSDPKMAETLLDSFDLTTLPLVLRLDKRGVVTGRYLSLASE